MKQLLLTFFLLIIPSTLSAQTHPCDVIPPSNPNVASPVKFGFCVPQTDVVNTTEYKIFLDNNPTPVFTGSVAPTGVPNAGGLVFVQIPPITVIQGSHAATASAVGIGGESAKSVAYPFVVIGAPVAPARIRIVP